MTTTVAALVLLLTSILVPQQEQDETVRDFKRYFRKATDTWERVEMVKALEEIDHPGVAEVLLPVLSDKEPHVARAALEVLSQLPSPAAREPLLKVVEKGKKAEQLVGVIRAAGNGQWSEFTELIRPHLGSGDDTVRLFSATAVAQLGDEGALPELAEMANKDKNSLVRVAVIDAMAILGKDQRDVAGPPLVEALQDEALPVQTAACLALRVVRVREAIPPLIDLLENGEGRILENVYPTLVELTDLQFVDDPKLWRNWWNRAGETYEMPTDEQIAARRADRAKDAAIYRPTRSEASFMGIDTPSKQVLFIIDVSGSMEDMVVDRDAFRERGFTQFGKLDIVKEELMRTIDGLDGTVRFNVIAFATEVFYWKKKLTKGSALSRRSATDFVRKLQPIGGQAAAARASAGLSGSAGVDAGRTNTYGALLAGLGVTGREDPASESKSDLDTIFFLSDGRPSVGELVDPDDILKSVTEINQFRRVTLHTIAIGEFQKDFMSELARLNGGIFVDLGR